MDAVDALKHIQAILKQAAESHDLQSIEDHLARAQRIIDEALPEQPQDSEA
jgi:hypothetical protein